MTNVQTEIGSWPKLSYPKLKDTLNTVHMWTQIVGKIRLKKTPWTNHSWHVSLYVTPNGLSTGSIPYKEGSFQIDFDFIEHKLYVISSMERKAEMDLYPRSVADFYKELFSKLEGIGISVKIHGAPNEVDPAIPFKKDDIHKSYDAEGMEMYWESLVKINNVFTKFRAKFIGKCSPVHFFWGGFDLAVTRFSGRKAPLHPGGAPNCPLKVMQEAYSHEVSSAGFWPGSDAFPEPVFYSYCYPTPKEFGKQKVKPKEAFYSDDMGEFFLTYESVRSSKDPEKMLMSFLQSTYEAQRKLEIGTETLWRVIFRLCRAKPYFSVN